MAIAKINNIGGGGGGAELIGTYTGNNNINVSGYINPADTIDNFIIEIISVNAATTDNAATHTSYIWPRAAVRKATPSKSLSGNTLSITGMSAVVVLEMSDTNTWHVEKQTTATISYKVWHV